ncbi:hypothetical protein LRP52_39920 [Photobacterium sp. ZSDE20]|uniref:Uncharacterized protein n=1 Tax=Photobacterium pectinilyticum TaxID=2906793 RepID=A0ABT1N7K2_9GAMM|nr:hypothetical protein [Photobacterium sp. ZSDE20]MCQ1060723.1 hypothetical protein [Photobacterium sp. ZSDE20]MDD1828350.1 hypothetical protein [Photobacterium sp. ZSDE20]
MIKPAIHPYRLSVLSHTATDVLFNILLKMSLFMDELETFDREAKAIRREDRKNNA